jgi:hypothetical protein
MAKNDQPDPQRRESDEGDQQSSIAISQTPHFEADVKQKRADRRYQNATKDEAEAAQREHPLCASVPMPGQQHIPRNGTRERDQQGA